MYQLILNTTCPQTRDYKYTCIKPIEICNVHVFGFIYFFYPLLVFAQLAA